MLGLAAALPGRLDHSRYQTEDQFRLVYPPQVTGNQSEPLICAFAFPLLADIQLLVELFHRITGQA